MRLTPFKLERYFEKHEFSAPYLLSCSDCESLSMAELLGWCDPSVLELWSNLGLGYTETRGHPLLRSEIASLYSGVQEEQVLVCAPGEGIFITMSSLLQHGDHVISMFPAYQSLYGVAAGIGCKVSRWRPEVGDDWRFNVDDLESLIEPETRLIIVNFPHNPTGAMLSRDDFLRVMHIAEQRDIVVFCDEMYKYLELDDAFRLPSAVEEYERAISLCGLSKSFGLPGLRIGWLVTRDKEIMESLASFKDYTTICSSAPSEILAIGALRNRRRILQRNLEIIQKNIELLARFFDRHSSVISWIPPKAGSLAMARLLVPMSAPDFCEALLEKEGVLLVPGELMEIEGKFLRIGFGRRTMPEALERLELFLRNGLN